MDKKVTIKITGKGDCVTATSFMEAVGHFLAILRGVDRERKQGQKPSEWRIAGMKMHSPPEITFAGDAETVDEVLNGFCEIETKRSKPNCFSRAVMVRMRRFVRLLNDGLADIEISSGSRIVKPTPKMEENVILVQQALQPPKPYTQESQVEGRLELFSTHEEQPEFGIYDPLTDDLVRCAFAPSLLDDVAELAKRRARVRVTGAVRYNAKHKPTFVNVSAYEPLPEQSDLPQLSDLHKARIDITGGQDSVDFIREQWDD